MGLFFAKSQSLQWYGYLVFSVGVQFDKDVLISMILEPVFGGYRLDIGSREYLFKLRRSVLPLRR